jgi:hypothetical protein
MSTSVLDAFPLVEVTEPLRHMVQIPTGLPYSCVKLSCTEYKLLTKRSDLYWYCHPCEEKTMKNLKIEKEVEERCNKYFSKYEKRLDEMESKLNKKVDLDEAFLLVEVTEPLRDMVQIPTGLPYCTI